MKKTLIYPFDSYMEPIISQRSVYGEYVVDQIVSSRSLGTCGKNVKLMDQNKEVVISRDYEKAVLETDAVVIVETQIPIDFEKAILPKIMIALVNSKEVIYLKRVDEETKKELENMGVKCLLPERMSGRFPEFEDVERKRFSIDIPVVAVVGAGENTGKFFAVTTMAQKLKEDGYKVSVVSARPEGKLLGYYEFPINLFAGQYSDTLAVGIFNAFLKRIEVRDQADVIIIEIPGGVLALNDYFVGDYGLLAYKTFCAVTPDTTVCTLYEGDYDEKFYDEIKKCMHYRFGVDVNYFTMNDVCIDPSTTREMGELKYINVLPKLTDEAIKKVPKTIALYKMEKGEIIHLTNKVIDELAENPCI